MPNRLYDLDMLSGVVAESGMNPLTKIAEVAVRSLEMNRDGSGNYRVKMACAKDEGDMFQVENEAYLDSFFHSILGDESGIKDPSVKVACSKLGETLGLELLLNAKG